MRRLSFLLGVILFIACNTGKKAAPLLNSSLLPSSFINVQPGKVTVFKTPKGATITILPGTFDKPVELEIKEAYTMADMLLGGLVTESDGKPLISNGMIYINTVNKEAVDLNKPIGISIPGSIDPNMKLFAGVEQSDNSINWTAPKELGYIDRDTPMTGRLLFWQLCAACHGITKDLAGPALAGARERAPDSSSFYEFIKNSKKVLASGNPYYVALFERYNKLAKNAYPDLQNVDIDQIMKYVEWAAKNAPRDYLEISEVKDTSVDWFMVDNSLIYVDTGFSSTPTTPSAESWERALRQGFNDQLNSTGTYTFSINTLGWYNIDAYVEGLAGTTLCDLKVDLASDLKELPIMNVYMFAPTRKSLSVGVQHDDRIYYFEKYEGKIPLFPDEKAFVIAFGNTGEEFYYGITGFTIKREQVIKIKILKTTKEEFLKQVRALKFEGIEFDVSQ